MKHKEKSVIKTIAFDINGTLVEGDSPRTEVIEFMKALKDKGHTIVVWSSYNTETIRRKVKELNLTEFVDIYASKMDILSGDPKDLPDIAFDDDATVGLAKEGSILI